VSPLNTVLNSEVFFTFYSKASVQLESEKQG